MNTVLKLTATPHGRKDSQSSFVQSVRTQELPSGPHERIEVDHIISYDTPSADDEVVTLLCRDIRVWFGRIPLHPREYDEDWHRRANVRPPKE